MKNTIQPDQERGIFIPFPDKNKPNTLTFNCNDQGQMEIVFIGQVTLEEKIFEGKPYNRIEITPLTLEEAMGIFDNVNKCIQQMLDYPIEVLVVVPQENPALTDTEKPV